MQHSTHSSQTPLFPCRVLTPLLGLLLSVAVAGIASAADAPVRTMRVPNGGGHPQAVADAQGKIHLLYFKGDAGGGDVFYVRSDDGGATFAKPLQVNSQPKSVIIAGTVRGPHLAIGRGGRVHVAWMGSSSAEPRMGKLAPMLYTRMTDAGDGFEPQRNVVAAHPGLDGGGSVAADADGNVYVAWHAPEDHGRKDGEEGRHVWLARSTDDGKTFAPERRVNPEPTGVCACCGMRIFAGPAGRLFVIYRSAKAVVNRDVTLLVSDDRGATFSVAATDPWKIGACMMSTASFAVAPRNTVLAAWETQHQIRMSRIGDQAKKADAPRSTPGEGNNRKHPSIAVNKAGQVLLTWTEETRWATGGSIAWQLFDAANEPIAMQGRARDLPVWGVPAVVTCSDGSFLIIY